MTQIKKKINKKVYTLSNEENQSDKGDYKNFMSKEIFEQPTTAKNCINEYVDTLKKDINIYNFPIQPEKLKKIILKDLNNKNQKSFEISKFELKNEIR